MKPIVLYKVVDRNTRSSSYAEGRFKLKYEQGCIVKEVPGSLGIFCFKTIDDATLYIINTFSEGMIIKVKPIGRKRKVPKILPCPDIQSLSRFYGFYEGKPIIFRKYRNLEEIIDSHPGTVCYHSVEVLD